MTEVWRGVMEACDDGETHHVVITERGDRLVVYIDGKEVRRAD